MTSLFFDAENFFLPFFSYHLLLCRGSLIIQLVVVERLSGHHSDHFSVSTFETKNLQKEIACPQKGSQYNYPNADQMYSNARAHKTHENSRNVSPWVVLSLVHLAL